MPARKRPGPAEAAAATRILLDGVARNRGLADIAADLAPLHPRNGTFPGEVLLRLAADALAWCGASRAEPVPLEGMRERFLPGFSFRGREKAKLGYGLTRAQVMRILVVCRHSVAVRDGMRAGSRDGLAWVDAVAGRDHDPACCRRPPAGPSYGRTTRAPPQQAASRRAWQFAGGPRPRPGHRHGDWALPHPRWRAAA